MSLGTVHHTDHPTFEQYARRALLPLLPHFTIGPAFCKQPNHPNWTIYQGKAGVVGTADEWRSASSVYVMAADELGAIIEYDDPALKDSLFLYALPKLHRTAGWVRTDPRPDQCHGGWIVRLHHKISDKAHNRLANATGHETASLRLKRAIQVIHGDHYDKDTRQPTGNRYIFNGQPVLALSAADTDKLQALFAIRETVRSAAIDRQPIFTEDWQARVVWTFINRYLDDLKVQRAGRNDYLNDVTAWNIGRLAHYVNDDTLLQNLIYDAAVANGYVAKDGEAAARKTIASGFNAGRGKPRYPFTRKPEPGRAVGTTVKPMVDHPTATGSAQPEFRQPAANGACLEPHSEPFAERLKRFGLDGSQPSEPVATIGSLVRLLNSDAPDRALTMCVCASVHPSTAMRRKARNYSTYLKAIEYGSKETQTVSPRQNWLRTVFPQSDPITALVPFDQLTPDHFDNQLTEDEIDDLRANAVMSELNKKQQGAIRQRLRTLQQVERRLRELDKVEFVQPRPAVTLSDLRGLVLRAILDHYTKVDPETGEIIPARLSNTVQACLLGVQIGALKHIRQGAGIEQFAPAQMEKPITHAQRLPSNTRRIAIKNDHGGYHEWREPNDPNLDSFIQRARRTGREVVAVIQPVAEQRIAALPERQPRKPAERRPTQQSVAGDKVKSVPTPKPTRQRRQPRQTYAAELMVNILYHLNVKADKAEPVDVLAGKVRSALKPTVELPQPIFALGEDEPAFRPVWETGGLPYSLPSDDLCKILIQMDVSRRTADLRNQGVCVA